MCQPQVATLAGGSEQELFYLGSREMIFALLAPERVALSDLSLYSDLGEVPVIPCWPTWLPQMGL